MNASPLPAFAILGVPTNQERKSKRERKTIASLEGLYPPPMTMKSAPERDRMGPPAGVTTTLM
jgi:hypothetical protein